MQTLNPRLTIQNTDSGAWLVRLEHKPSDMETLDITLLTPRSDASATQLQRALLARAIALLTTMHDSLGT